MKSSYSWLLELIDDCLDFVDAFDVNKREINILCFGDSITTGFTNHGLQHYPYSDKLQQLISDYFKINNKYHQYGIKYEIDIQNVGVNGERISDTMYDRLFNILNKSDIIFDLIIITGGINDIYAGYSAEKIWDNEEKMEKNLNDIDFMESTSSIKQIYEMILDYQENKEIKLVATTITPFEIFETEEMNKIRCSLNDQIISYCNDNDHAILCDLNQKFPKFDKDSVYWDVDSVHFTKDGYSLFAEILFESIQDWLLLKLI